MRILVVDDSEDSRDLAEGTLLSGGYDDVVPHLTVGYRPAGEGKELLEAEADVLRWLPVQAHISRVWLMTGRAAPGSWQTIAELPLTTG